LQIAGCRVPIFRLTIVDCDWSLPIVIADWRLDRRLSIGIADRAPQLTIQSSIGNENRKYENLNLQSAI
jgi:hypothetical protein